MTPTCWSVPVLTLRVFFPFGKTPVPFRVLRGAQDRDPTLTPPYGSASWAELREFGLFVRHWTSLRVGGPGPHPGPVVLRRVRPQGGPPRVSGRD